jgi:ADP-heptose:LPS heptosyltransferase
MTESVLIRTNGALGDVIMTTPIVARLRHQLGPDAIININTFSADVFARNPHVSGVNVPEPQGGYHRTISLELAYERRPHIHAVDAYMLEVFSDTNWPDKQVVLHKSRIDRLAHLPWDRAVALHAGVNTASRTFPITFWNGVVDGLLHAGFVPIVVGSKRDRKWPDKPGVVDLSDLLSIHEVAGVIDRCRCFITGDTGVCHIAGSTLTPIIAIYTMAKAALRMPWRKGIMGWGVIPFEPDLDCVGCFKSMWNLLNCQRGDFACVNQNMVAPEQILGAVFSVAGAVHPSAPDTAWRVSHQIVMQSPDAWRIPTSCRIDQIGPDAAEDLAVDDAVGDLVVGELDARDQ